MTDSLLITLDAVPASDSWGFVGRVLVGEIEAYRTIRAYPTPTDAANAATRLPAESLGPMLAGKEWQTATDEFGHAPRRVELGLGLTAFRGSRSLDGGSDERSTAIDGDDSEHSPARGK